MAKESLIQEGVICAPVGIRTPNLLIRSQMLYPLSYGRLRPRERARKCNGGFGMHSGHLRVTLT